MLLTITTTHNPATDLGYLLHKHPDKVQSFKLNFGQGHVFYPEATPERCTAALLLDIDPIRLSRRTAGNNFPLQPYVNDRPYVASSFLSVAITQVFGSALNGRCKDRPELVEQALPLQASLPALSCRGGEEVLRQLFEPLGYTVDAQRHTLDENFPDWGASNLFSVRLSATVRLCDLLTHLYVLVPVLDDDKHYWVGDDEVEKLLGRGGQWLAQHPQRQWIADRYLKHQRQLVNTALDQLSGETREEVDTNAADDAETAVESAIGLHQQRLQSVVEVLEESGATRVLDLGCGEGKLLALLLKKRQFEHITGLDVSHQNLQRAAQRLHLDTLPERQRQRLELLQGSLLYRDDRLAGYDAAALVEVIEHLDLPRLPAFERTVFEFARPATVIITTPNQEYNTQWPTLAAGHVRHRDHRFEWSRAQFQSWAATAAQKFGYAVRFADLGPQAPDIGAPTQMGVFTL
jgi:3' terminal RNA ribose 2'-O-methyltransferase Hen1